MLHIENRTRFPDIQSFIGSYNAKRAYLAPAIAERVGLRSGFATVDHVVVALWSSEVLHALRLRGGSFSAVCPDSIERFEAWWSGSIPGGDGTLDLRRAAASSSSLAVFDPLTGTRTSRRRWIRLDEARRVDPRYRDYSAALTALRNAGAA